MQVARIFMGQAGGVVITIKNKFRLSNNYSRCLSVRNFSRFKGENEVLYILIIHLLFVIYISRLLILLDYKTVVKKEIMLMYQGN